ncbi:MAG: aminodeoxychorismate/anthranilate synthase component II [Pseudobacteriovorax sp.]|nr:aminodeoxychorismate/anthranilate synthase component II [Pseudobacteriovorax sp.]
MNRIFFIDHYDSFSLNLKAWLLEGNPSLSVEHVYYDQLLTTAIPKGVPLVMSPGPKSSQDVLVSLDICRANLGKVPIFGVCLGHQILANVLGGWNVRAGKPFHGSKKLVTFNDKSVVYPDGQTLEVASYNSLVCRLPKSSEHYITAENSCGEIEMIEVLDRGFPAIGCQFHPESFMSKAVRPIREYFLSEVDRYWKSQSKFYDSTLIDAFITDNSDRRL